MYLRNAWYVAAWGEEIGSAPLGRTLLGEPVVLYRGADGKAVALADRCCHRGLPLSMGRVEGDRIRCGYHGLVFDPQGICVEVPGQPKIPPGAGVRLTVEFTAPKMVGTFISYWKSVFEDGSLCFPKAQGLSVKVRVTTLATGAFEAS